jgi:hypothetical protein
MDRRSVQTVFGVRTKSASTVVNTGSARDCYMAASSKIPFDYVPPPEDVVRNTVPYKWPSDEEWSRAYIWDSTKFQM